jgi:ribosomal protein L7/L12
MNTAQILLTHARQLYELQQAMQAAYEEQRQSPKGTFKVELQNFHFTDLRSAVETLTAMTGMGLTESEAQKEESLRTLCKKLKDQNQRIEAVRLIRATKGCGLREAMVYLDAVE